MRILIIDDDITVLKALELAIRTRRPHWEADVLLDPTGLQDRLIQAKYDVVLSDISMPQVNGMTVLRRVKAIVPLTPVVFLTGYRDRYAAAAWELGAFGVLDKPVDINLLFETLEAAALCRLDRQSTN